MEIQIKEDESAQVVDSKETIILIDSDVSDKIDEYVGLSHNEFLAESRGDVIKMLLSIASSKLDIAKWRNVGYMYQLIKEYNSTVKQDIIQAIRSRQPIMSLYINRGSLGLTRRNAGEIDDFIRENKKEIEKYHLSLNLHARGGRNNSKAMAAFKKFLLDNHGIDCDPTKPLPF